MKHAKHAKSGKVFGLSLVRRWSRAARLPIVEHQFHYRIGSSFHADHCVSYVGPSWWQVNKHASQRHEYIQMAMRIIARVTCKSSGTGNGDESVNPAVCLCRLSCCLAGIPYQPGLADHWLVVSIAS